MKLLLELPESLLESIKFLVDISLITVVQLPQSTLLVISEEDLQRMESVDSLNSLTCKLSNSDGETTSKTQSVTILHTLRRPSSMRILPQLLLS
jgi:hypothetical protein